MLRLACAIWLASTVQVLGQTVTIDPTPRQTLTSFGASGAWWPNDIYLFPAAVQENLTHLLFSEDGLHLSAYRYNIGADSGNASKAVPVFDRQVQSFLRYDGSYDWNVDIAGINMLNAAQAYGVPYVTFFANAAPSYIADGAVCGWSFEPNATIAYAEYLKTVLTYWTDYGIDIKYVSPMNEPDYGDPFCTQEGMNVSPVNRGPIVQALQLALEGTSAQHIGVIADESNQVTQSEGTGPEWLNSSLHAISNIAVHNYDFPTDAQLVKYYSYLQNITKGNIPPVKFTETCCSNSAGNGPQIFAAQYDPTMGNALIVARYVWQFLTIVNAQSFEWWSSVADLPCSPTASNSSCATSISTSGYNSGLIYIDPNYNTTQDYTLWLTKRAWMMKHFATFHRPGCIRYDIPQAQLPNGVNAIATANRIYTPPNPLPDPFTTTWSVLFIQNQTSPQNLTLMLPQKQSKMLRMVQTTNQADFEDMALPSIENGAIAVTLPAESLVTIRFETIGLIGFW